MILSFFEKPLTSEFFRRILGGYLMGTLTNYEWRGPINILMETNYE